jgi:hypothetical protein
MQSQQNSFLSNEDTKNKGLENSGNDCFLNVLIQSLYHLEYFKQLLLSEAQKLKENVVVKEILQLFTKLSQSKEATQGSNNLRKVMCANIPVLKGKISQQEDSSEFYGPLLNYIEELQNENSEKIISPHIFNNNLKVIMEKNEYIKTTKNTPIKNTIKQDTSLILELPVNKENPNFEKSLENYFQNKDDITKYRFIEQRITNFPNQLVILFKKYKSNETGSNSKKLSLNINFPKILSEQISQYSNNKDVKYELSAVINHNGGGKGGHYTACCKEKDGWYFYNDNSNPTKIEINNVINNNPQAYVLFYEKIYEVEKQIKSKTISTFIDDSLKKIQSIPSSIEKDDILNDQHIEKYIGKNLTQELKSLNENIEQKILPNLQEAITSYFFRIINIVCSNYIGQTQIKNPTELKDDIIVQSPNIIDYFDQKHPTFNSWLNDFNGWLKKNRNTEYQQNHLIAQQQNEIY